MMKNNFLMALNYQNYKHQIYDKIIKEDPLLFCVCYF